MKKLMLASVIVGSAFAGTVLAAGTALPSSGGPVTTTDCSLLAGTVTVNLSSNVSGAFQCDLATNAIRIGTCHAAGSRQTTTVDCVLTAGADTTDDTSDDEYNGSSCGSTDDSFDITDFRGFVATSQGGSVTQQELGGACSDSTLTALEIFD
ncbi:hypothetical protein [Saccharospirillum alexandrii]|uniref:hypothetical protein n=1 Tax=Saccharospirillum alexandrii TaxID=2448477 RepID=UPI000FD7BCC7|nr:hypothetical protein [Saccharospirillum alexandrii]